MSQLNVVSSKAVDVLLRPDGSRIDEISGGPAFFIRSALQESGVDFTINEGEKMQVEVKVYDHKEISKVARPSQTRKLSEIDAGDWCIISTLLNEWSIDVVPKCAFVDIQGYVRDGSRFGGKRSWPIDGETSRKIYCLKGTAEEISYLPAELVEDQKANRMLVITDGERGSTIYCAGEQVSIPAELVENLPNTVGAGDTFFAYFAASLYQGNDFRTAGAYASTKTAEFLSKKIG